MLRRSYYPPTGQHLHAAIVRLYVATMTTLVVAFLLLVRWVIL
jgi:hypothetical protein